MKKDKDWLKTEIKKMYQDVVSGEIGLNAEMSLFKVYELVKELDEPEVLSQKWVDENVVEGDFRGEQEFWYGRFIEEEKVRNLFVPKKKIAFGQVHDKLREESILSEKSFDYYWNCINDNVEIDEPGNIFVAKQDKPVIPKFVADYIERWKPEGLMMCEWFTFGNNDMDDDIEKWLYNNTDEENRKREYLLIDAIRNGYEVEKEQKYHVVNKENYFMLRKYDGLVDILHVSSSMSRDEYGKDTRFMLTEKEIKDYDERYWAFAVEVME